MKVLGMTSSSGVQCSRSFQNKSSRTALYLNARPRPALPVPRAYSAEDPAQYAGTTTSTALTVTDPSGVSEPERLILLAELKEELLGDLRRFAGGTSSDGLDWSKYSDDVIFRDPITNIQGRELYKNTILALKLLFNPGFEIHSSEISGYDEILVRWTMVLNLQMIPTFILGSKTPELIFTGTTTYSVDLKSKKVTKHVDTWDSVKNQSFFSVEGAVDMVRQILAASTQLTPNIPSPAYTVLLRRDEYEIRKYPKFTAVRTEMNPNFLPFFSGPNSGNGFNDLAGYIFGGNKDKEKMEMTTPVISTGGSGGKNEMLFPLEDKFTSASVVPQPNNPSVRPVDVEEAVVAAYRFGGIPTDADVRAATERLRELLRRDTVSFDTEGYQLARYNDPFTPFFARRNEIIIKLSDFTFP